MKVTFYGRCPVALRLAVALPGILPLANPLTLLVRFIRQTWTPTPTPTGGGVSTYNIICISSICFIVIGVLGLNASATARVISRR